MPQLDESVFDKGIIYICQHDKDGAMGIMLNKPIPDIDKVLSKFELNNIIPKPNIYLGGPVDLNKGFVIHKNDYETNGTLEISKNISLTSNLKIVNDILDKEFDKKVFRTKNRPIASGKISVKLGITYALILCFCALLILLNFNTINH